MILYKKKLFLNSAKKCLICYIMRYLGNKVLPEVRGRIFKEISFGNSVEISTSFHEIFNNPWNFHGTFHQV